MWKIRLAAVAVLVAVAAGIVLLVGLFLLPRLSGTGTPPAIQSTASIIRQVQGLSQLVTVKYVLEKVVVLDDVKWYGESRVLLIARGVVKAGVNLKRMEPGDLKVVQNRVEVSLPPPEILDVYLDDRQTRVVERNTGLLRTFDKDLEQEARRQAVDDLQRSARYSGILQDAEERAQLQLGELFRTLGLEVAFRKR
jgi:hypothetical protein